MEYAETTLNLSSGVIVDLERAVFNRYYTEDQLRERLSGKRHWIYMASDENIPVAFKIWYEDLDGEIYSWLGGVLPGYRRRGIASRLMDIQFDLSREGGYFKIRLKTHDGHPEMISLCRKRGFTLTGIEKDHWGPGRDAIFFEFDLGKERSE